MLENGQNSIVYDEATDNSIGIFFLQSNSMRIHSDILDGFVLLQINDRKRLFLDKESISNR